MKLKKEKAPLFGSVFSESDFGKIDEDFSFGNALSDGGFRSAHSDRSLYLNRFDMAAMSKILKKVGLVRQLAAKGYSDPVYDIYKDDQQTHYFKIFPDKEKDPSRILIDLRLSEKRFIPSQPKVDAFRDVFFDMFVVEWLQTQNPDSQTFPPDRPQLPGQIRPGLGCLKYLMLMMQEVSPFITIDGFLDIPDHFHLAVMYTRNFHFFDPVAEGLVRAVLRDTEGSSLSDITWGVMTGNIVEKKTGIPFVYTSSEEIFSVSDRLKKYFSHRSYVKQSKEAFKKNRFVFDRERMLAQKEDILRTKNISEL